jgi:putative zinc finger/helix-turn-helix YgiT family protein
MNTVYCPICKSEENYTIEKRLIREFKGYDVNVEEKVAVCKSCNNDIYISQIENENFNKLYGKYRELAGVIAPEEIVEFRNKYGISQRELTSILNWGKMTLNRYEHGSIPNTSNNDIIKLIISKENIFNEMVEDAYHDNRITEKTYKKIKNRIQDSAKDELKKIMVNTLTNKEDEYNGYRKFDIEKLNNLISYIADNVELYKTSLNKYLWFIDFKNFKENIRSVTGLRYMRYTFGPIIEDFKYEELLNFLDDKFYKEEYEDDCKIITIIRSKGNYDLSIFKEEEMEVINNVISLLKEKSCTEISNLSHKEEAWIKNKNKDLISYEYAYELKLS